MKYSHLLECVARTPWAIDPTKAREILALLAFRAAGHRFTADELLARVEEAPPATVTKRASVAMIPLRGIIAHRMGTMEESSGGMSAERFTTAVQAAAADDDIEAILLDVDSPGGTIPGVPEAAEAVFKAREQKRVAAIANAWMASAAYWIASQATEIVAIPSALEPCIGSIGVFTIHEDLSAALAQEGVKITMIKAGKHKADWNPFEPLPEETRAEIQAAVDGAYDQFVKDVARGRGVTATAVRRGFGEGRALTAVDAKAAGLIDRIGTLEETIGRLVGKASKAAMRAGIVDADEAEDERHRRFDVI